MYPRNATRYLLLRQAILSQDGLVVPDALLDERFADNPLVLGETGIRFYAGQPLRAADGSQVGTVCIKDHRTRSWCAEDGQLLRDLADLVEDQFHLIEVSELQHEIQDRKRAEEALRKSEQRFRTFVDHATDGFFLHDDKFVIVDVNRKACESLGYARDELLGMTPVQLRSRYFAGPP